jgi:hypothetical protein
MLDLHASKQPGPAGYFFDRDLAGTLNFDAFQETLEFIWSQYALAPHILTRSTAEDLVIGNLTQPLSEETAADLGLQFKKDLSLRLYLHFYPAVLWLVFLISRAPEKWEK